jgi:hypothetical protein
MTPDDRSEELLAKILETQRAHFEEYKRVTSESLAMQRQATEAQARHLRVYKKVIIAGSVIIVALIAYALWLSTLIL